MITDLLARKYRFNVPGDKGELELDTANSALDRTAPFQSQRAKANAVNPRAAEENPDGFDARATAPTWGRPPHRGFRVARRPEPRVH